MKKTLLLSTVIAFVASSAFAVPIDSRPKNLATAKISKSLASKMKADSDWQVRYHQLVNQTSQ